MTGPSEGEYRARGLVDVVIDPASAKSIANHSIPRSSLGSRRPAHDDWISGWASLDPTYEYPLLDDRKLDGRVRFTYVTNKRLKPSHANPSASVPTTTPQVSLGAFGHRLTLQPSPSFDVNRKSKRLTPSLILWTDQEWHLRQHCCIPTRKASLVDIVLQAM